MRPFLSFPNARQPVSSGMLSALIQLQRQDLLTGLVDVAYEDGSQALLFFNVGTPFALFFRGEGNWRKVPASQWPDIFGQPDGAAAILPLGGDALRLSLLALEAGANQTESILLRPAGLRSHLAQVQVREAASLLWVRNDALQSLILVPGRSVPVQDALLFSASGIQSGPDVLNALSKLDDQLLHIVQYEYTEFPQYMREYALRVAFQTLTEQAFLRFEQLAGDALMESLGQEMNRYAFHQGWKIQIFGSSVQHRQFFQEANEAAAVYRSLFRLMKQYAHRVVGAGLAAGMVTEGVDRLPPAYRSVFEQQNFTAG